MADRRSPDEEEITHEYRAGVSQWLPVDLSFSRKITRRWTNRANQFQDDIATESGMSQSDVSEVLDDAAEELGEAYLAAGQKAVRTPDAEFRRALARVVAAGLRDGAKVDEAVFLTGVLTKLEVVDLRTLDAATRCRLVDDDGSEAPGKAADVESMQSIANIEGYMIASATRRLEALGLLTQRDDNGDILRWSKAPDGWWWVTPLGWRVHEYCKGVEPPA